MSRLLLGVESLRVGIRKLDLNERGDFMGVGTFPPFL
jgi:hypothetical protein